MGETKWDNMGQDCTGREMGTSSSQGWSKGKAQEETMRKSSARCSWAGRWGESEQRRSIPQAERFALSWGDWVKQGGLWGFGMGTEFTQLLKGLSGAQDYKTGDVWSGLSWGQRMGLLSGFTHVPLPRLFYLSRNQHSCPTLWDPRTPQTLLLLFLGPGEAKKCVNGGQMESIIKTGVSGSSFVICRDREVEFSKTEKYFPGKFRRTMTTLLYRTTIRLQDDI